MMPGWLLERAARVLNRQIDESISASRVAAELEGRSCRVAIEGLGIVLVMRVEQGRTSLFARRGEAHGQDVSIEGTPFDLLRLLGPDAARRIQGSAARVSGEVHTAEKFAELLRLAAPDLEEELSGWVGDIAAHALAGAAQRGRAWAAAAVAATCDNAADYLQEERRDLPGPHEAEAFYADVDRLRDDVERAAARLERLAAALVAR